MAAVFPLFIYFLADFARSLGKQDLEHEDIQKLMRRGYFKIIREFEKPQLAQTTYRPLNICGKRR